MQEKNKIQNSQGFSLIELIVSIAIIVTLVSVFLVNFAGLSKSRNLNVGTNNLVSDLHKIQSFSLSSQDLSVGKPATIYGVVFNNNAASYNLIGFDNTVPVAVQSTISSVNLPPNTFINSVLVTKADNTTAAPTSITILFKIPFGRVLTNYTGSILNELNDITRVKLQSRDGTVCSYVTVNGITGNVSATSVCP